MSEQSHPQELNSQPLAAPWEAIGEAFTHPGPHSVEQIDAAKQAFAAIIDTESSKPDSVLYLEAATALPYCAIFEAWSQNMTPSEGTIIETHQQLGDLLSRTLCQTEEIADLEPEVRDQTRQQMALLFFVRLRNPVYLAFPASVQEAYDAHSPFHLHIPHRYGTTPCKVTKDNKRPSGQEGQPILAVNLSAQIFNTASSSEELHLQWLHGKNVGSGQRAITRYAATLLAEEAQGKELTEKEANFLDDISFALCERAEEHTLRYEDSL